MFLLIFAETVGVLSVSALIRKAKLFCTAWNARFAAIIRFTPFESKCGSSGKPAVFRPAVSTGQGVQMGQRAVWEVGE